MKHYKNTEGEIFAFEMDGSQDHLIKKDFKLLTQIEADEVLRPKEDDPKFQIMGRLEAIDRESIGPARAIAAALANDLPIAQADAVHISALEDEAEALRAELASLKA